MTQRVGKRAARSADLRRKALDLRVAGAAYTQIAEALGISRTAAYGHVAAALASTAKLTAEDAEKVRAVELQRLDSMLMSLWGHRSDPRTADTILRAMDRRARLLGLDSPDRHEHSGPDGKPLEMRVTDARERLMARIAARLAPGVGPVPPGGSAG